MGLLESAAKENPSIALVVMLVVLLLPALSKMVENVLLCTLSIFIIPFGVWAGYKEIWVGSIHLKKEQLQEDKPEKHQAEEEKLIVSLRNKLTKFLQTKD